MAFLIHLLSILLLLTISEAEEHCEDVKPAMCQDMPYNQTRFPNSLSHPTQGDAEIQLSTFAPLIQYDCSPALKPLLCSMYIPKCSLSGGVIKPCRTLCEQAREGCEPVLQQFGFTWPDDLLCEDLTQDDNCFNNEDPGEEVLPVFDQSDSNATFIEGETAVLPCDIRNIGSHKVAWTRQSDNVILAFADRRVVDDIRFSVKIEYNGHYDLIIQDVSNNDSGSYQCTVNTSPALKKYVHLSVTVYQPAQVLASRSSGNLRIMEFGSATLVCQATGNPVPSITWIVRPFSEPPAGVVCQVVPFQSENCPTPLMHVVHVIKITRHCAGIYECIASNGEKDTHAIQIDVTAQNKENHEVKENKIKFDTNKTAKEHNRGLQSAAVKISTPIVHAAKGTSAFLRCHAPVTQFGQSQVTLAWSKEGKDFTDSSKYKTVTTLHKGQYIETALGITGLDDNDYGEYVCSATIPTIGVWTGNVTVETSPEHSGISCQPIAMDVCTGLPYTTTTFPNIMQAGHSSQADALEMMFTLAQIPFNTDHPCMKRNMFFRCAMLVPPCTSTGDIALPCQNECKVYKKHCFFSYRTTWPEQWECDRLPNQGDCISQDSLDALNTDDGHTPFITFLPPVIEQVLGGNALIQCTATIYPFGSFYFEKDGRTLYNSPTSNHKVEFYSEGYYSYSLLLHLKGMILSDFGGYKCVAKNSFGVSVEQVHVRGLESPPIEDMPNITTNTSTVKSVIGQTASLCFTMTLPKQGSRVSLKKDNIILKASDRIQLDRVLLKASVFLFTLKLSNLSDADQGIYTLEMAKGTDVIKGTVKLLVGLTPRVTVDAPFKFIRVDKFEASFRCEVHYGKNSYRWKLQKDGKTIEESLRIMVNIRNRPKKQTDILTVSIWEFTEEDVGLYTCVATNLHGKAQADIAIYAATVPQMTLFRNMVTPDKVTLSCTVKAYPIADVYWTKGSITKERLSTTRSEQVEHQVDERANSVVSVLHLTDRNRNRPTEYFCIAENVVGKEHMSLVDL